MTDSTRFWASLSFQLKILFKVRLAIPAGVNFTVSSSPKFQQICFDWKISIKISCLDS